jgi:hypothetical protein
LGLKGLDQQRGGKIVLVQQFLLACQADLSGRLEAKIWLQILPWFGLGEQALDGASGLLELTLCGQRRGEPNVRIGGPRIACDGPAEKIDPILGMAGQYASWTQIV